MASLVQQDIAVLTRAVLLCETEDKRRRNEIMRKRPGLLHIEKNKRENVFDADSRIERLYFQRQHSVMQREHSIAFLAIYDRYCMALSRELTRKSTDESRSYSAHLRKVR